MVLMLCLVATGAAALEVWLMRPAYEKGLADWATGAHSLSETIPIITLTTIKGLKGPRQEGWRAE